MSAIDVPDGSDSDLLEGLRRNPAWDAALEVLAQQALALGRLREAVARAEDRFMVRLASSSNSSAAVPPHLVPEGPYSHLRNNDATFLTYLREALEDVLGMPRSVIRFEDDD